MERPLAAMVIGTPPDTINITGQNNPVQVLAGRPTIIKDVSNGGMPLFANPLSEEAPGLNTVPSSFCDLEGNLWFGTAGAGVCRYNGKTYVYYDFSKGLCSNVVFAICQDSKGNMWFGTSAGLCKYDGYKLKNFSISDGLAGNMVTSISEDSKHQLWIGTQGGGLSKYDGKKFVNYRTTEGLSDNYVRCLLADVDGRLWIGTGSEGIDVFDGKNFFTYTMSNGLINNSITSIIQEKPGVVWIGTNQGVSRFDGKTFTNYSAPNGLPENNITSLFKDKAGNIWMGSNSGKLIRFDGHIFKAFDDDSRENMSPIVSILQDRSENIWITRLGGSVTRYQGDHLKKLNQQGGLAGNMVFAIAQDKNKNIWLGAYRHGVSIYNGRTFENYTKAQGLSDDWIWNIMRDRDDNLWIATDHGGVCKFDGKQFTTFTTKQGLLSNSVMFTMQDKAGRIWFGTPSGVSVYNGRSITNFTTVNGLPGLSIMGFAEDDQGNIWIATHDDGVCKYDGNRFYWYKKSNGLASNSVYRIMKDQHGNIWIATNSGLTKFDGKKFTSFTTADGLADNYIWMVTEDTARNIIWIGSNKGVTALKQDKSTGACKFQNFNEQTGFPIKQAGFGLMVDSDGILWIGSGRKEVIRLDYEQALKRYNADPLLKIENIKVNNETIPWQYLLRSNKRNLSSDTLSWAMEFGNARSQKYADSIGDKFRKIRISGVQRFYSMPDGLKLPYDLNSVSFDFVAIDPVMQNQMAYQYKLDGYSNDWSPLSNSSNAVFGNIKPGDYTFRVKAFTPWGSVAEETFSFSVLAPWWRTWWAYSIAGILVVTLLYVLYRLRISALKRKQTAQINVMVATQEDERKRLARDLHDGVGIKLSALKMFVSGMYEKAFATNNEGIKTLAEKSEALIGETMTDVRQILVNLSPSVLEEFGYTTAVEGLVNKINETKTLHFDLVVFGMNKRLQKDYELALYRITQELMNNILKHADAKQVSVQIGRRDEKIILMVEDDGKGFDVKEKKDGYGLHNLDIRTKLMNGSMTIDSTPGKGTSVLIEIPYQLN